MPLPPPAAAAVGLPPGLNSHFASASLIGLFTSAGTAAPAAAGAGAGAAAAAILIPVDRVQAQTHPESNLTEQDPLRVCEKIVI